MEMLLDDMAKTLRANITLPRLEEPQDNVGTQNVMAKDGALQSFELENDKHSKRPTFEGEGMSNGSYDMVDSFVSPPLPTSPPLLSQGLSHLNLTGLAEASYPSSKQFQTDGNRIGEETLRESVKRVKARC